jgi:hypothetical protein
MLDYDSVDVHVGPSRSNSVSLSSSQQKPVQSTKKAEEIVLEDDEEPDLDTPPASLPLRSSSAVPSLSSSTSLKSSAETEGVKLKVRVQGKPDIKCKLEKVSLDH